MSEIYRKSEIKISPIAICLPTVFLVRIYQRLVMAVGWRREVALDPPFCGSVNALLE